jgi:tetratricopeptide (TPR) repeat protein
VTQDSAYPEHVKSGEHIQSLTYALKREKKWPMKQVLKYVGNYIKRKPSTIYRLQQGNLPLTPENAEKLVRLGKEEAKLPAEWASGLLTAANHPNSKAILEKFYQRRTIPCNLPTLHTELHGREGEVGQLLERLRPEYAVHFIAVEGIGGVGKTALVLTVANRCHQASTGEIYDPTVPAFEAIIFVTAQQEILTSIGIKPQYNMPRTLHEICQEVARVLGKEEAFKHTEYPDSRKMVLDALSQQSTLLVVDNLETMEDQDEVVDFLYSKLPRPVKTIVTSRERNVYSSIRLDDLAQEPSLALIHDLAQAQGVAEEVTETDARRLYSHIGGVPAAFMYAIGMIVDGDSMDTVLKKITDPRGEVAGYIFTKSVGKLHQSAKPAYLLLLAAALFPKHPLLEAVAYTANGTDPLDEDAGFNRLQRLNLIKRNRDRCEMLPLTREYALRELAAHPALEREVRERWIEWHSKLAKGHGGHDWEAWYNKYDRLEAEWNNFLAVFEWCAHYGRYKDIKSFWQTSSEGSILEFTDVYGHWDGRLHWLIWLIEAAKELDDKATEAEARVNAGFTLTLMGRIDDAKDHFECAWDLARLTGPEVQLHVALDRAYFYIMGKPQYSDAKDLLDQATALLDTAQLSTQYHARIWTNIQYDFGLLYYKQQNYPQAKKYFQKALEHAAEIQWERAAIHARKFLADVAIEQGELEGIERLLLEGLEASSKDKREIAFYKSSLADFYKKRGDVDKASSWALEACDSFERLGMRREAQEKHKLLQELQS